MSRYAAFLRGINLGKRRITMESLRENFQDWGFEHVRTILASGNVVFESKEANPAKVRAGIEQGFANKYNWEVPTCVRSYSEIKALIKSHPFAGIEQSKQIQPYVTFFTERVQNGLNLPYVAVDGYYRILAVQPGYVVSVLDRRGGHGTLDAMDVLKELFGDEITTRNWNTVLKVYAVMDAG